MKAVIALGSNLGDRRAHLEAGLAALHTLGAVVPSPLVMETLEVELAIEPPGLVTSTS